MPDEKDYEICECVIDKAHPFPDSLMEGIIRKIRSNNGKPIPEGGTCLRILAPTYCRDCVSYLKDYFCCNQERVDIYKREKR